VACFGCQGRKLLLSPFLFMFSFLCFIFHIWIQIFYGGFESWKVSQIY
jgi:hypothetical protein